MGLKDLFVGFAWFGFANIAFYLFGSLFQSLMSGVSDASLGVNAMSPTMQGFSWAAYIIVYLACCWGLPAYFIIKGASASN